MAGSELLWTIAAALAAFVVVGIAYQYGFAAALAAWLIATTLLLILRPQ